MLDFLEMASPDDGEPAHRGQHFCFWNSTMTLHPTFGRSRRTSGSLKLH